LTSNFTIGKGSHTKHRHKNEDDGKPCAAVGELIVRRQGCVRASQREDVQGKVMVS